MNRWGELNRANQCDSILGCEVEFNSFDQMIEIYLNVDEYIKNLNSIRNIDRDFKLNRLIF